MINLELAPDDVNYIVSSRNSEANSVSDAGSNSSTGSNANADANTGTSSDNATLEYLQNYNARTKQFNNFDAIGNYTTEFLSYVHPTAVEVASTISLLKRIFRTCAEYENTLWDELYRESERQVL